MTGFRIVILCDSGQPILRWCEEHQVGYGVGLSKNKRLIRALSKELHQTHEQVEQTGPPARVFKDFTRNNWSKQRRVNRKVEQSYSVEEK